MWISTYRIAFRLINLIRFLISGINGFIKKREILLIVYRISILSDWGGHI